MLLGDWGSLYVFLGRCFWVEGVCYEFDGCSFFDCCLQNTMEVVAGKEMNAGGLLHV